MVVILYLAIVEYRTLMGEDYSNSKGSGSEGYSGRVASDSKLFDKVKNKDDRNQSHHLYEFSTVKEGLSDEYLGG